jgi:hypothetical protein
MQGGLCSVVMVDVVFLVRRLVMVAPFSKMIFCCFNDGNPPSRGNLLGYDGCMYANAREQEPHPNGNAAAMFDGVVGRSRPAYMRYISMEVANTLIVTVGQKPVGTQGWQSNVAWPTLIQEKRLGSCS